MLTYQLDYPGGVYSPGLQSVAPGETLVVDIGQLRSGSTPDEDGDLIPEEATGGQVLWSSKWLSTSDAPPTRVAFIGRAEYVDFERGLSSTYSCNNCCPDSYYSSSLDPNQIIILVDEVESPIARQFDRNCYGALLEPFIVTSGVWSSSDTSVATVSSSGQVECVAPGVATVKSEWNAPDWNPDGFGGCDARVVEAEPIAEVKAIDVRVNSADLRTDEIEVELILAPSTECEGTLKVELLGTTTHAVFEESRGPGTYAISFDIPNLPVNQTFQMARATWTVEGEAAIHETELEEEFKVLGKFRRSQYNTPPSTSCSGSPTDVYVTEEDSEGNSQCFLDPPGDFSTETVPSMFVSQANLNGSAEIAGVGDVQRDTFCPTTTDAPTGAAGITFRHKTIVPACGGCPQVNDGTVARGSSLFQDLPCCSEVYIDGVGVKTVTDECPDCPNDLMGEEINQLDNYTTNTACSMIGDLINEAMTIRIY